MQDKVCVDIDACAANPCSEGIACVDLAAPDTGFLCGDCPKGFDVNQGDECVNIDECELDVFPCDVHASCADSEGSFTCTCDDLYEDVRGNGTLCMPMDMDADGVSDALEIQNGTDPNDFDSDDDGSCDGYIAMDPRVVFVDDDASDDVPEPCLGQTWATAHKTIALAMSQASGDDQVWVAAGTPLEPTLRAVSIRQFPY